MKKNESRQEGNGHRLTFKMYRRAEAMGGQVSEEHGVGYARKACMRSACGPRQIELVRGIKRAFDPDNISNPGKRF